MKLTTLCYIEKNEQYLMLHRNTKKNDPNTGKWIGVGGKIEEKESPEECMLREVREETGLDLTRYQYRGLITFVSDEWETEYMHLYTADEYLGKLTNCDEGTLEWVDKQKIFDLNLWEGDRIFLQLLVETTAFFTLKLVYQGDHLKEHSVRFW